MFVLILNSPPHTGIHRVQRRLAEQLEASWERIDPFCHLDDHRHLFADDVASGFEEAVVSVEGAIQRQRCVIIEWRLTELTYDRLVSMFEGLGCKLVLATFAPPRVAAMSSPSRREMAAKKRLQVRRFYERGCHRHSQGIVIDAVAADPDVAAASIIELLRDQL